MPSPVGHILFAFAISGVPKPRDVVTQWWPVLVLLAAIAPDLDFLPGIVIGDPNRFHHGPTHSIAAAVVFTLVIALMFRSLSKTQILVLFLVYAGHVLIDTRRRTWAPHSACRFSGRSILITTSRLSRSLATSVMVLIMSGLAA